MNNEPLMVPSISHSNNAARTTQMGGNHNADRRQRLVSRNTLVADLLRT